jgi:hypothetical protein
MLVVTIVAEDDDVEVREDQLLMITEAQLEMLGMSRDTLAQVFKDAAELMKDLKPGERLRPVAKELPDGTWKVFLFAAD